MKPPVGVFRIERAVPVEDERYQEIERQQEIEELRHRAEQQRHRNARRARIKGVDGRGF